MTRAEKREKAIALRAAGATWADIDEALGYTRGSNVGYKLVNDAKTREWNRRTNARRRAQKREWDRTVGRKACGSCGGPMGPGSSHRSYETCWKCREAEAERKRGLIRDGYREGLTAYEIAERTGIPKNTVLSEACRMRRLGIAVPYGPTGHKAHRDARGAA